MSRDRPVPGCWELPLEDALELPPAAQVALEDYARAVCGARAASVVPTDGPRVAAVHVCGTGAAPTAALRDDVLAFARELALREGGGLGWS